MKKTIITVFSLAMLASPLIASAHAHASYEIGGVQYDFVIGSLNEPLVVDDKSGLDLRVSRGGRMTMAEDGDMEATGGIPATGLESDLKVEMISGDARKTFDISPVFGTPGTYSTSFYPTVATTFSYRLFGTIEGTPVDLTFTCRQDGAQTADEGEKQISTGVTQLMKGGGFGCPEPKESYGFPEQSASARALAGEASQARIYGIAALALGALAIALTFRRRA